MATRVQGKGSIVSTGADEPAPGLYIVATPVGNLGDMTARGLETLRKANLVVCEDSRVTGKLLHRFGIDRPMAAYHEHNAARVRPALLARLAAGERLALVSDAGTPLISDPGYKLVAEARAAGHGVVPVPGACAFVAAAMAAGLPTDRLVFLGFLPPRPAARRKLLEPFRDLPASLLLYESPHRLAEALVDLARILGDREAAVCRELTKLHEEIRRGRLGELAAHYEAHPPKGEIVLMVAPPEAAAVSDAALDAALARALATMSVREAAEAVAGATGVARRKLYARALALRGD